MRLLIDTNVILEVMLGQSQAQVAQRFLALAAQHEFHLTNFALHSIEHFLQASIHSGNLAVLSIPPSGIQAVVDTARLLQLDFDDAYQ